MKFFVTFYQLLTATVYFNSLQQFSCCNAMPFAAGFWQDSANLFLQFRANQLFMPTRIVLLWKKSSKQGKKENCYLMRKKTTKTFHVVSTYANIPLQTKALPLSKKLDRTRPHTYYTSCITKQWSFQKDFTKSPHNYPSPYKSKLNSVLQVLANFHTILAIVNYAYFKNRLLVLCVRLNQPENICFHWLNRYLALIFCCYECECYVVDGNSLWP